MINPAEYTITVRYGEFDGENCFEARVKEFPDVAEYGDSFEEAYSLAIDTIEMTAEIFAEKGKKIPVPTAIQDDYSGRVTLRLAKSLHRALAIHAEDEGVSLNQHIVNVLTYNTGFSIGQERGFDDGWNLLESTIFDDDQIVPQKTVRQVPLRSVA